MIEGKSYEVREEFKIALGATRVVVLDDRDLPHVLPLLTMIGWIFAITKDRSIR